MPQLKVTNHKTCTHYCARLKNYKGFGKDFSIFGNPFTGNKTDAINKYKIYFYNKLKSSSEFKMKFLELVDYAEENDTRLGCFCAPEACHCDVIQEAILRTIQLRNNNRLK